MINLSGRYNAVMQAIESGEMLQLYMTVTPIVGNKLYITNDDIYDNQFKIDKYVQSGSSLEIGTCAAAELTCELNNSDGKFNGVRFEGAELMVEVYLPSITESATGEPVKYKLGYFTVDEKPRMLETVSIAALDRMVQFDRPVASDVEFGAVTFQSLVSTCCEKCSVPFDAENFNTVYPLGDRKATVRPDDENLTYRNIIQYIAELGLCCAYIGTDGKLKFGFYKDTNISGQIFNLEPQNMFSHTMDDEEEKGIDSVKFTKDEQSLSAGIAESQKISTVNYSLSFELKDVPLGETSFNQDTLKTLYEKKILRLKGVADQIIYIPYSAQTFSYFFLEPLDSISLADSILTNGTGEKIFNTLITHITFNLNQSMLVEAKGESDTKKGYATLNPLTAEEKRILDRVRSESENRTKELAENVTDREQKLIDFNKLLNSGGALYKSNGYSQTVNKFDLYTDSEYEPNSTKFVVVSSAGVGWANKPWIYDSTVQDTLPEICDYFIDFNGTAVLSDLNTYRVSANLIQCDDLQAISAKIAGWNLIDGAITTDYTKDGVTYRTYFQSPVGSKEIQTGSYVIGIKVPNTTNYMFAVSPLGEVKAAGLVRTTKGFRASEDFDTGGPFFQVDVNDENYKMKLFGNFYQEGEHRVDDIKFPSSNGKGLLSMRECFRQLKITNA